MRPVRLKADRRVTMKPYRLALFIFRRDLRLFDNTGLRAALEDADTVLPLFIIDPRQAGPENAYRGAASLGFMGACLTELAADLEEAGGRLFIAEGPAEECLNRIISQFSRNHKINAKQPGPGAIYFNRDYTPFSRRRDESLRSLAERHGIDLRAHGDALLNEPETTRKPDGTPYTVFTPFFRRAREIPVRAPRGLPAGGAWWAGPVAGARPVGAAEAGVFFRERTGTGLTGAWRAGGRREAVAILKKIANFSDYNRLREIPAEAGTTGLSPHNKFGTISPREFYHAVRKTLGADHGLIRELYWRDFFTSVAFFFPHVFGGAFRARYDRLPWRDDQNDFDAWREGRTGFPIVDAGMRELLATGNMHNRVRMVVASFLTKDLRIDWRMGERHFARHLLDYDPSVNNGNWQWAASTGCDAQPYFRVFNPWSQQKKFDPDGAYIRRWVSELREKPVDRLHKPGGVSDLFGAGGYPAPMLDHGPAAAAAKAMFREL